MRHDRKQENRTQSFRKSLSAAHFQVQRLRLVISELRHETPSECGSSEPGSPERVTEEERLADLNASAVILVPHDFIQTNDLIMNETCVQIKNVPFCFSDQFVVKK